MNKYDERLFRIWKAMKNRCLNKNNNRFSVYGGKGIKICDEWLDDFNSFKKWSLDNGYDDTIIGVILFLLPIKEKQNL